MPPAPLPKRLDLVQTHLRLKRHSQQIASVLSNLLAPPRKNAPIDPAKSLPPKSNPSKINTLDSRLRGNDAVSCGKSCFVAHKPLYFSVTGD
jgi:hypothetical protein